MMDSGAANHVCNPKLHFLQYLISDDKTKARRDFVTATGQIIHNLGEKRVRVETERKSKCNIVFQCADVDIPVLSTRKLCQSGHEVTYRKNGGVILDRKSGQQTKFILRGGVYYVKLKVLRPGSPEKSMGFARPEA